MGIQLTRKLIELAKLKEKINFSLYLPFLFLAKFY